MKPILQPPSGTLLSYEVRTGKNYKVPLGFLDSQASAVLQNHSHQIFELEV